MDLSSAAMQSDPWFDWLTQHRHAGDAHHDQRVQMAVARYADRVLDGAALREGMTLVDLGAGDGLVGFRALERVGSSLKIVMVDISARLLQRAEAAAAMRGVSSQCTFLVSSAECLDGLKNDSVDAVTTRSSLAYVSDKKAVLRECFRILKPGGRLSIAEPSFRDNAQAVASMRIRMESGEREPAQSILPFLHRWQSAQYPDTQEGIESTPMTCYTERDLLHWAQAAGFRDLHLELHVRVSNSPSTSWEIFLDSSPHPLAPSLRTILRERFTSEERRLFEAVFRPMLENSELPETDRMIYLRAVKPSRVQPEG